MKKTLLVFCYILSTTAVASVPDFIKDCMDCHGDTERASTDMKQITNQLNTLRLLNYLNVFLHNYLLRLNRSLTLRWPKLAKKFYASKCQGYHEILRR